MNENTIKALKLSTLRDIAKTVEVDGPSNRKASYINPLAEMYLTAADFQELQLDTLKDLASFYDVEPEGHAGHKASYIAPLLDAMEEPEPQVQIRLPQEHEEDEDEDEKVPWFKRRVFLGIPNAVYLLIILAFAVFLILPRNGKANADNPQDDPAATELAPTEEFVAAEETEEPEVVEEPEGSEVSETQEDETGESPGDDVPTETLGEKVLAFLQDIGYSNVITLDLGFPTELKIQKEVLVEGDSDEVMIPVGRDYPGGLFVWRAAFDDIPLEFTFHRADGSEIDLLEYLKMTMMDAEYLQGLDSETLSALEYRGINISEGEILIQNENSVDLGPVYTGEFFTIVYQDNPDLGVNNGNFLVFGDAGDDYTVPIQ